MWDIKKEMDTVKSEQAKGLTLDSRRKRRKNKDDDDDDDNVLMFNSDLSPSLVAVRSFIF